MNPSSTRTRPLLALLTALLVLPLIAATGAEVRAAYNCDGTITVTTTVHAISNIVVRTEAGDTKISDPFEADSEDEPDPELFEYTLDPAAFGEVESLFVKAGNNGERGKGNRGYGEEITAAEIAAAEDCGGGDGGDGPVLGTGDVQVTLEWTAEPQESVDMDLYVIDPSGERIAYYNTMSVSGGELDRDDDICGNPADGFSIENVFWAESTAPTGTYTVGVDEFGICQHNTGGPAEWTLTVKVDGAVVLSETGTGDGDPTPHEAGSANTFTFDYPTP